ncbi:MAG TPA: tetraacyldisaccharide 4'-kinase [Sedimenticola thiotaurini]|uniref:Tetraacyldisaccharide 4'-kinase n=1 Tax=Sedimenticola thiotaurini TaxID=1543721 RepID=A0A831RQK9_9GAMM|nr:tetraacyldisaccharide 4'-kinase [Sedimenticola thiotaurini]
MERQWQGRGPATLALLPLAGLFCTLAWLRRQAYAAGILRRQRLPVPVIVVGNISVGGVGKTPLVIWLVRHLRRQGWNPGVISRGYGGRAGDWPRPVGADSDPAAVGDEPVLIARAAGCPLWVGPDRPEAARRLLAESDVDLLVSDDGLQHYALERDLEIVVIDGGRRLGNRLCLPAGPLREPPGRLRRADLVVVNGPAAPGEAAMELIPTGLVQLADPRARSGLEDFRGRRVHAVAGIGHPQRFFRLLQRQGLEVIAHPFPDHHPYRPSDLAFDDGLPILMTGKDAVKCRPFADARCWSLEVELQPDAVFIERLNQRLQERIHG